MTIKELLAGMPKEIIKKTSSLVVRECDEIESGKFVAYVDEGKKTYDLSFFKGAGDSIVYLNCDCKSSAPYCLHKVALLLHFQKEKPKKKASRKSSGRADKFLLMIESADRKMLDEWLIDLLLKNQDIAFSFEHKFGSVAITYASEEVALATEAAAQAVIRNKKKADLTQLKKLIEVWANIHEGVVEYYCDNVTDAGAFDCFHEILKTCMMWHVSLAINSVRIPNYLGVLLKRSAQSISRLESAAARLLAIAQFVKKITGSNRNLEILYVHHLKAFEAAYPEDGAIEFAELLMQQYQLVKKNLHYADLTKFLFEIVLKRGMFKSYQHCFRPITYDNHFNRQLIEQLFLVQNYQAVEIFCIEQINNNVRDEFNILYLRFLEQIYTIQNNEQKLVNVVKLLFPFSFALEDFLFVRERIAGEIEKKNWRSQMLARARSASGINFSAMEFCFDLLALEKNFTKMLTYIDSETSLYFVNRYFEPLLQADKAGLLRLIFKNIDNVDWYGNNLEEFSDNHYIELAQQMKKYYNNLELIMMLNASESRYYRQGRFRKVLLEALDRN